MRLIGCALLAAAPLATSPAAAQLLVRCTPLETNRPEDAPWLSWQLAFAHGRVAQAVVQSRFDGQVARGDYTALRPGLSSRTFLYRLPAEPVVWRAVFNLATVESDGSVLFETWERFTHQPALERYTWYRLRCEPQG